MARVRGLPILALIVLACTAEAPALAVASELDGRPRPYGYPDTPTIAYGPIPPCYLDNKAVTCDWYGFAHILYPDYGLTCLMYTRKILADTSRYPPGSLKPYTYYYMIDMVFNTGNNDSYCIYGCFDMSTPGSPPLRSAPPPPRSAHPPPRSDPPPPRSAHPPPRSAPPPPRSAPPPPRSAHPPPRSAHPPPRSAPPPPTVATPPPPAALAPPPPTIAPPPPATTAPPPALVAAPPPSTIFVPPPNSLAPPALPPSTTPAVPPPEFLNGAGFLQPTGLVSFIISGALLILNGLVGF